jgi:hypothetical protein
MVGHISSVISVCGTIWDLGQSSKSAWKMVHSSSKTEYVRTLQQSLVDIHALQIANLLTLGILPHSLPFRIGNVIVGSFTSLLIHALWNQKDKGISTTIGRQERFYAVLNTLITGCKTFEERLKFVGDCIFEECANSQVDWP